MPKFLVRVIKEDSPFYGSLWGEDGGFVDSREGAYVTTIEELKADNPEAAGTRTLLKANIVRLVMVLDK